ncbi:MAG: rod shape-determining protein MreC, partial [Bacteroidota bacterium]
MRNLVLLFLRFGHFILFVLLELLCLYLIVNYNRKQRAIWDNSSNIFMGKFSERYNDFTNYFSLQDRNAVLAAENARLKEKLINYGLTTELVRDTSAIPIDLQYELLSAKVTNNSTNKSNNNVVINKGARDGIKPDMGVISQDGIVGIITKVTDKYAVANSLLHRRTSISAMIKRNNAYGGLRWVGNNPRIVNLTAIPKHHPVEVGDTIVTSGYSTHFPPDLLIGVVEETSLPEGSNFHEIK